jgi:MFS family permease
MSVDRGQSYSVTGFVVWGICALFFLYEFLLRTIIGTFQPPIMSDLNLTSFKFSLLSTSTYLLIYGAMQIPVGLIIDRYGLKKSLFLGAAICSISTFGFAYANDFYSALFFRMLTGLGSSFGFICLLVAVYEWMPKKNIALLIGLSQFIGTLGPMFAAGPVNAIAASSGISWRTIFVIFGVIGVFLTLMIVLFVKNCPRKQDFYLILRRPDRVKTNILQLFSRSQPWIIAFFSASIYFSIEFLSENEGKIFLTLKGFSSNFSSYMLTVSWLGYAFGCPLLGFLSDYFQRRKSIMVIAAMFAIISMIGIVFSSDRYVLISSFFLLGVAASGQSVGFATISEQFKSGYLSIGLGLNNAMITLVSATNAPIIGLFIDSIKKTKHATLGDYQVAFYSLIAIACLALVLVFFFIKETFCKSDVDYTYLNSDKKGV